MEWNIVLGVATLAGSFGTFYFGWRARKLSRERRSITWPEIQAGAVELLEKAMAAHHPDCIVMMSGPSALIASIAMTQLKCYIPTYLVAMEDKDARPGPSELAEYRCIDTPKWWFHVPSALLNRTTSRLLVIDDSVIHGDSSQGLRTLLESCGFDAKNVYYASLLCSKIARDARRAPDFSWLIVEPPDFYYPWGLWY